MSNAVFNLVSYTLCCVVPFLMFGFIGGIVYERRAKKRESPGVQKGGDGGEDQGQGRPQA